ncbi:MAG: glycosyltransferase family 4 protein [Candidatus Ryanbacteria bacterium]|nr:glycosyltransferase family 4 protein [Candidatus Ryanbacteria bacterium]
MQISTSRSRGIGLYITHLLQEFRSKKVHNFHYYALSSSIADFLKTIPSLNSRKRTIYWIERGEWLIRDYIIRYRARHDYISIFHSTDPLFVLPSTRKYKAIATVYDIIPLLFKEDYMHRNLYGRFRYKTALKNLLYVDKIITLSYTSREDIHRVLGIPKENIVPIYLGVDRRFAPPQDKKLIEAVKKKYGIDIRYVFYVGGVDHRKNLLALLEAFALLQKRHGEKMKLVLAGDDINFNKPQRIKILKKIEELSLRESIILTGYLPIEELVALYSGAELFCFPSLYEGFGLPVVEAMACGVPVVTSRVPSLKEVAGEAAYLVDPTSIDEISEGMYKVLSEENIRNQLIQKGFRRASQFSWERTAQETLKVYEEIGEI